MLIPHQQGSVALNSASFSPCSRRSPKSCLLSSEQLTRQCPAAASTAAKAWHLQTCEWRGQLGSLGKKDKSTLLSRISLETGNTTANKEQGVGRRSSLTVEHCAPDLQGKHNSSPTHQEVFSTGVNRTKRCPGENGLWLKEQKENTEEPCKQQGRKISTPGAEEVK